MWHCSVNPKSIRTVCLTAHHCDSNQRYQRPQSKNGLIFTQCCHHRQVWANTSSLYLWIFRRLLIGFDMEAIWKCTFNDLLYSPDDESERVRIRQRSTISLYFADTINFENFIILKFLQSSQVKTSVLKLPILWCYVGTATDCVMTQCVLYGQTSD